MSQHIKTMQRAIEFGSPPYIPMELTDIPGIYNAYDTCDPEKVTIPAGAENFDSAWCTYHWTFKYLGKNEAGEPIRRDEWGCKHVIPRDEGAAYTIIERPTFATLAEVEKYPWPAPSIADRFFESRKKIIASSYPDRFICGFLDPGPLLIAFEMFGYDGLLLGLHDQPEVIKAVLRKIVDYQLELIPRFREMGAHMVNIICEVAGTGGMLFAPQVFRTQIKPFYDELFAAIHRNNMYTSILLDGNIVEIMPDLMPMELDQQFFAQPLATGHDVIAGFCRGKRCVKMAVDMMQTLATGTPDEIEREVDALVNKINTPKGGLVFQALRWHRPTYDPVRVQAQIKAMNKYRKGA